MCRFSSLSRPLIVASVIVIAFSACHSSSPHSGHDAGEDSSAGKIEALHAPEFRQAPRKEPVAEYSENMNDPLNKDWVFSVRLFETRKTLAYRVAIRYGALDGADTIRLPDLGGQPRPVIKQGPDKYSCIIGFIDNDSTFRDYKLAFAKGDQFGIKTLKHYAVTQGYRLEIQEVK
ncbi:MAG: hypothetical protein Q8937_11480 [Bacteroidota bacterium]|nr:hypothetical protein [Bacteroidota bacterium]